MTGYGRAEQTLSEKTYLVEIKALNGKQLEMQLKIPALLKSFEFEIRNLLQEQLLRGSIDCLITIKQNGSLKPVVINTDLIKSYYTQIAALGNELHIETNDILSALLRLPEVVTPSTEMLSEAEFLEFTSVLNKAIEDLNKHRLEEGATLEKDLVTRIENIKLQEEKILQLEPQRKIRIKEEIKQLLEEHVGTENIDHNRMEQELI